MYVRFQGRQKFAVGISLSAAGLGDDITADYLLGCLLSMGAAPIGTLTTTEGLKRVMSKVGQYLKADYEFWKEKGWLEE